MNLHRMSNRSVQRLLVRARRRQLVERQPDVAASMPRWKKSLFVGCRSVTFRQKKIKIDKTAFFVFVFKTQTWTQTLWTVPWRKERSYCEGLGSKGYSQRSDGERLIALKRLRVDCSSNSSSSSMSLWSMIKHQHCTIRPVSHLDDEELLNERENKREPSRLICCCIWGVPPFLFNSDFTQCLTHFKHTERHTN